MDEQTMLGILRSGWGKPDSPFVKAFQTLYSPDATPEQLDELIAMQLATIGPERVAELRCTIDRFDVSPILARVRADTLVLHAERDAIQPLSQGQKIAACISRARLHRLESRNHIPLPQNPVWREMMDQLDLFLKA
jgi:pimeloyl-ACP methyl ester carboxylesterase